MDLSGIEAITAIRAEFPNARIIVLTTYTPIEVEHPGEKLPVALCDTLVSS
jgi:ActR/RegA family two-component response regulator